jgi:DNA repair protein SbcD/Mre11
MKILHTSDLHLGETWRGNSRLPDQLRVLEEVLNLSVQHKVETLLITGDIFGDRLEGKLSDIARQFLQLIHERLQQGQVVFLLRGNHDPFNFFQLLRVILDQWVGAYHVPLVIADLPEVYKVPGKKLQVLALPYLSPSMIEQHAQAAGIMPEERINILEGRLASYINLLGQQVDPNVPAIFAGHVLVRGTHYNAETVIEQGTLRELTISSRDLPGFTSYNALGHIHLAQQIKSTEKPTWYSGGPDRLDMGERSYSPQVLLITTPDQPGGAALVEPILLKTCTQFISEAVKGVDAVETFCREWTGKNPLGVLELSDMPVDRRAVVEQGIHMAAPRLELRWVLEPAKLPGIESATPGPDFHDVAGTVQTYLAGRFSDQPDRLARLIKAFKTINDSLDSGARP